MTRTWIRVPRSTDVATLGILGVRVHEPRGRVIYVQDDDSGLMLAEIGEITVNSSGQISLYPRLNLRNAWFNTLLGCGEDAFRNEPSASEGWGRRTSSSGQAYWWCAITVPVGDAEQWIAEVTRTNELAKKSERRVHTLSSAELEQVAA